MRLVLMMLMFANFFIRLCSGAAFTAMTRLRDLALMEKTLVYSLNKFIDAEKSKLEKIVKIAERVKNSLGARSVADPDEIFSSPVEVYALLKRFVYPWKDLQIFLTTNESKG